MPAPNRWLVLTIVSSALFLIVIDMTVLYTALPRLTKDLSATATQKLWILNAYPLVVAGLLPGLGGLGDRVGHKRMFLTGLIVFGVASLIAAFAPTSAILIGARVLLAIGAAMMMPATLSLIRLNFPDDQERAFAIGVWAAVASGGAAFGPVIGGLLLEFYWWGSVFLINVPIVILAFLAGLHVSTNIRPARDHPFDLVGSIQVMIGLVGLIYAIKEASKREPSWMIAVMALCIGMLALVAFFRRQRASANPLIDFALFRNARFSSGVVAALVASGALIGVELVFSQRLQLVLDLSPLQAGLMILPIPVASFFAGPLTGVVMSRVAEEKLLSLAMGLTGIALAVFLMVHEESAWLWLSALAVVGFGIGATMTAASSIIMLSAPQDRAGMAASIEELAFELGGALGVAILGSLMTALYTRAMTVPVGVAAKASDSLDEAITVADGLHQEAATKLILVARSAFDEAFVSVIGAAALLTFGAAILIWRRSMTSYRVARSS